MAPIVEKFDNIGLSNQSVGTLSFNEKGLEWRGPSNAKAVQVREREGSSYTHPTQPISSHPTPPHRTPAS